MYGNFKLNFNFDFFSLSFPMIKLKIKEIQILNDPVPILLILFFILASRAFDRRTNSRLTIDRFTLRTADDSVGCLGDDYCPPQCNCAGSVVRCSRSQLTEIPRGIPPETTELYLDVNDIKTIQPERLNHLRILTRL